MKGLIKRWARDYLYTGGPKVGSPSKVAPDAKTAQGIQPGTGQKIGAEEMNYLLALLCDEAERSRFAGLATWASFSSAAGLNTATRAALGGTTLIEGTADAQLVTETSVTPLVAAGGMFDTGAVVAETGKNSSGEARAVLIGGDTTGVTAYFSTAHATFSSHTLALSGAEAKVLGAAYDEANGAIVALCHDLGGTVADNTFVRFADAGAVLAEATTAPATIPLYNGSYAGQRHIAAGGGRAICLYGADFGGFDLRFAGFTSTDGGDTWSTIAVPTGTGSVDVAGIWYVDDFQGLGPKFVALAYSTDNGYELYHTSDGSAWVTIAPPAALTAVMGSAGVKHAIVLGDTVIASRQNDPRLFVWDTQRGTVMTTRVSSDNVTRLLFDGERLFVRDSAGAVLRSGRVSEPSTLTLGRMSD